RLYSRRSAGRRRVDRTGVERAATDQARLCLRTGHTPSPPAGGHATIEPLVCRVQLTGITMTTMQVEQILSKIKTNPAFVMWIYPLLTKENFWTFVRKGTEQQLETAEFLTYESRGCGEIPIFTSEKHSLYDQFKSLSDTTAIRIDGVSFFKRMRDIIETGKTE